MTSDRRRDWGAAARQRDPAGYRLHGFDCDAVVSSAPRDAGAVDAGKP